MVMRLSERIPESTDLDAVFGALADPTRRAILRRLSSGEASVKELTEPFNMSQPAVSKHLRVLERAGLVERRVEQRRRPARLRGAPLEAAVQWLRDFERFWTDSFGQLDSLLAHLKEDSEEPTP